jgi:hypothetical protein
MPGGGILSKTAVPLLDDWDPSTTFALASFDKLDVTAYNGDALVQYLTPALGWQPPAGQPVRRGNFRSIPGLSVIYPPGPTQLRFKRAATGVASSVDFDAYTPDLG